MGRDMHVVVWKPSFYQPSEEEADFINDTLAQCDATTSGMTLQIEDVKKCPDCDIPTKKIEDVNGIRYIYEWNATNKRYQLVDTDHYGDTNYYFECPKCGREDEQAE